jgi:membrane associated rhomboid family serine protease
VTPPIVKKLLIANGIVFALQVLTRNGYTDALAEHFAVVPREVVFEGRLWQVFTYMFLHSSAFWMHIAFNMLALWMFGSPLALVWGEKRFLRFYLTCGVGAGVIIVLWPMLPALFGLPLRPQFLASTLGASGAVYGILLGYTLTWPDRTIMLLFPPIPIRAIYFVPFIFFMSLAYGGPNISHAGHLGGLLVGWIMLRRQHGQRLLPGLGPLRHRWRRFRMRRRLRAVRSEETRWRERSRHDDDRWIH